MQRGVRGTDQAFVGRIGDQARRPAGTFTGGFVGLRMATAEGQGEVGAQWTGDRASVTPLTFLGP